MVIFKAYYKHTPFILLIWPPCFREELTAPIFGLLITVFLKILSSVFLNIQQVYFLLLSGSQKTHSREQLL